MKAFWMIYLFIFIIKAHSQRAGDSESRTQPWSAWSPHRWHRRHLGSPQQRSQVQTGHRFSFFPPREWKADGAAETVLRWKNRISRQRGTREEWGLPCLWEDVPDWPLPLSKSCCRFFFFLNFHPLPRSQKLLSNCKSEITVKLCPGKRSGLRFKFLRRVSSTMDLFLRMCFSGLIFTLQYEKKKNL